ncbi:MAG: hydantoinase/oxoprolinase family protein [Planctomyces sp.]
MQVLGLDIGGANIKAATSDGLSEQLPFAIWKSPQLLGDQLRSLQLLRSAQPQLVALTMTAELADCFATRSEGVRRIIETVTAVFPETPVRVWLTSGEFAGAADAVELPELVAAANWHALATWVGRAVPAGPALLIDLGSTTTDLVPLSDGLPIPVGLNDLHRLAAGELLYTGARRTPVCALVRQLPLQLPDSSEPQWIPIAAEMFATIQDAHLLTGGLPEEPASLDTADGRPATRASALNRLAHQFCCDETDLSADQLTAAADWLVEQQIQLLQRAISRRLDSLAALHPEQARAIRVLISGSGSWLAARVLDEMADSRVAEVLNLSEMFVSNVSVCAPAFAVARLAAERCWDDLLPMQQWQS